jgi:2-dehydropantoate 2-reductase
MRYIIYGAGAIGGVIGAKLHQGGHEVALIARGAHLAAIKESGLTLITPAGKAELAIPAYGHPSEIDFRPDDVVLMTMKTQDTAAALDALRAAAGEDIPVVCAQNGLENERLALRRFANVYGAIDYLPATHLEPGVVVAHSTPVVGVVDGGRYPSGVDDVVSQLASDLETSQFSSRAVPDIMRWKYDKLISNLPNAVQALCGPDVHSHELSSRIIKEAIACYEAAGVEWVSREEGNARRGNFVTAVDIEGQPRGPSAWQSLLRGSSTEVDYFNGEIVLMGRLHGVPTPANHLLQRLTHQLIREGRAAGSLTVDDLLRELAANEG